MRIYHLQNFFVWNVYDDPEPDPDPDFDWYVLD